MRCQQKVYFSGEEDRHECGVGFFVHKDIPGAVLGDNHVTCVQLSKPDVVTLSYRRSHYWWQKER